MRRSTLFPYLAAFLGLVACLLLFVLVIVIPGLKRELLPAATPTSDLSATLNALPSPTATFIPVPTSSPTPAGPTGKIAYVCQVAHDQICLMNADGSQKRRLTTEDGIRHFYPSLAPDGKSVVYSAYREDNVYEIYEMILDDGQVTPLTDRLGVLTAPEISPDGRLIVFTRWTPDSDAHAIWVMERDGSDPRQVFGPPQGEGWDPTWSPDGTQILFASDMDGFVQLYVIGLDGSGLRKVTQMNGLRGRSDWSPDGEYIVTYAGEPWLRELFLMRADGSDAHQITPTGGNSQGPSFSPDGRWVAFTAYFDHFGDVNGCEIYIMRTNGADLTRLTDNAYCDWQPRWGP